VPYSEKGIGITNVKQRLEFIYPGNYELSLKDEGCFFMVTLLVRVSSKTERSALHLTEPRIRNTDRMPHPQPLYR
jgi:hypothetical protein